MIGNLFDLDDDPLDGAVELVPLSFTSRPRGYAPPDRRASSGFVGLANQYVSRVRHVALARSLASMSLAFYARPDSLPPRLDGNGTHTHTQSPVFTRLVA